jgi:hypothetical protein
MNHAARPFFPTRTASRQSITRNIDRAAEIQEGWDMAAAFSDATSEGHLRLSDKTCELLASWWKANREQRLATAFCVLDAITNDMETALNDMALEMADNERGDAA